MPSKFANFNPYLKWLGIRATDPDHYQLLGIERFEDDADVIAAAADRQMAHVRKYQNGPHSERSQQILNELAAAKICLLDQEARSKYDAELVNVASRIGAPSRATRPRRSKTLLVWSVLAASFAALLIAGYFKFVKLQPSVTPEQTELVQSTQPPSVQPGNTEIQQREGEAPAEPERQTPAEAQSAPPPPPPKKNDSSSDAPLVTVIDLPEQPDEQGPVDISVAPWDKDRSARKPPPRPFPGQKHSKALLLQALHDRNQAQADKQVELVLAEANGHMARLESFRLEVIYWKFTEFWQKVAIGRDRLKLGSKFDFGDQKVKVTELTKTHMTLEAPNGKSKRYQLAKTKIDPDLAIALARNNGQATGPMLDVMIAIFLATDRDGDLRSAVPLLKKAKAAGIPVEVLQASDTMADQSQNSGHPKQSARLGSNGNSKRAVPQDGAQKSMLREVREVFGDLYRERTKTGRQALVRRLLETAHRSEDDSDVRFVMYNEAIRVATECGDVAAVIEAQDALEYQFSISDSTSKRLAILKKIRPAIRDAAEQERFCSALQRNAEDLIQDDNYPLASEYLQLLGHAARTFRSDQHAKWAKVKRQQVERLQDTFPTYLEALRLIVSQADSEKIASANAEIGLFLVLEKYDFEQGCIHLAVGSDPQLAAVATADLDSPSESEHQLALADLWWNVAEDHADSLAARKRASHWYQMAATGLSGFAKKRAVARIQLASRDD